MELVAASLYATNCLTKASRWTQNQFLEVLNNSNFRIFLASPEDNQQSAVAYAIFSFIAPEAHLVNVAVAPGYQRQGVGQELLKCSLTILAEDGIEDVWLEVRESNNPARNFYKKSGFTEVQKRKEFYEEPREDAWLMQVRI